MVTRSLSTALVALVLCASARGAELFVPGDFATLPEAVAAASAGDTIVITSTAPGVAIGTEPLVIDKPLKLVGVPFFEWTNVGCGQPFPNDEPSIRLAGPGHGAVTIISLIQFGDGPDCVAGPSYIEGGGFESLHLYDTVIQGFHGSQATPGAPGTAIDVSVARVLVSATTILGGATNGHSMQSCDEPLWDGGDAIHAPGAVVIVHQSTVQGGNCARRLSCETQCPDDVESFAGPGRGGRGVVADELWTQSATVEGGFGATLWTTPTSQPQSALPCGAMASGADVVAARQHAFGGAKLTGSGPMESGGPWVLGWDIEGIDALLFYSPGPVNPVVTSYGVSLLNPAAITCVGILPPGDDDALYHIPNATSLFGAEIVLQALTTGGQLTEPVLTYVLP